MKQVVINNTKFEIIQDYREGLDLKEVESKLTEYFDSYDYIVGDWAYGKLRLKGFYESTNKLVKNINDFKNIDNYIKNSCAYNCKYFILKKIN
jgi:uncharacterized protein YutD